MSALVAGLQGPEAWRVFRRTYVLPANPGAPTLLRALAASILSGWR